MNGRLLSHPAYLRFISICGQRDRGEQMQRTDLEPLILRWKMTTRALRIHEQPYGAYITDILEQRTDAELARFTDPVEAAAFYCLLEIMQDCRPLDPSMCRRTGIPGQSLLIPGDSVS